VIVIGYSVGITEANKEASIKNLGVRLGRLCIKKGIPVSAVANYCSVSRTAVYNWFSGKAHPKKSKEPAIYKLMSAEQ
jgi:transcriptional regulator with XRE-family HTH domain